MALVTEWKPFRHPDFEMMKRIMTQPIIFDGRNQYNADMLRADGFEYFGIGRHAPAANLEAVKAGQ
jgi:UDPglucose 6-dehydrogenase